MQFYGVDSVIEILSEGALLDHLLQVAVGAADQTDIYFFGRKAADTLDFIILQDTEQLCLKRKGHFADFVQKQGSGVSQLKFSHFSFLQGSGKGTFFIAEKLGFHQFFGDRSAVDFDKRLTFAQAHFLDGRGKELLADAGLPGDQDRDVKSSVCFDRIFYFQHLGCIADDAA